MTAIPITHVVKGDDALSTEVRGYEVWNDWLENAESLKLL